MQNTDYIKLNRIQYIIIKYITSHFNTRWHSALQYDTIKKKYNTATIQSKYNEKTIQMQYNKKEHAIHEVAIQRKIQEIYILLTVITTGMSFCN